MKNVFYILLLIALLQHYNSRAQADSIYNAHISNADKYYNTKEYKKSAHEYTLAFAALGNKGYPNDRYNAACVWSLAGNADSAFHNLFIIAEKSGYSNYSHFSTDPDLDPIHNDKRWKEVSDLVLANKEKEEANLDKLLVRILDTVLTTDQQYRMQLDKVEEQYGRESKEIKELWQTINYYDSVNVIKVTAVLDKRGWLGPDVIGNNGSQALFLVIQHADIEVQQKYLPMMRDAVKNGKARGSSLALLEDRVALRAGGKQIYGSQIGRDKDGNFYVSELEDPENVDKRRAEVGLPPLGEYTRNWNFEWNIEAHKKKMEELANLKNK
ncbi:MAG: hypothetical protein H6550_04515 [Chitinophagales bacterium]|nr:hypothetical protein [Chitinophagales bacterium]